MRREIIVDDTDTGERDGAGQAARPENWLQHPDQFEAAVTAHQGRRVLRSSELRAVLAAVAAVPGADNAFNRSLALRDLGQKIDAWEQKSDADNPRRAEIGPLAAEVAAERAFTERLLTVEQKMLGVRGIAVDELGGHITTIDELELSRFAQREIYRRTLDDLALRRGIATKRIDDAAAHTAALNDPRFADVMRNPAAVFAAYLGFVRAGGLQYSPSDSGVDVLADRAGPADCGSVARGLHAVMAKVGVESTVEQCESRDFLTQAIPAAGALPGDSGVVRDATPDGRFPGRRYFFPQHWVVRAGGALYCGVIGTTWRTADHVDVLNDPNLDQRKFQVADDAHAAADLDLRHVFEGGTHGLAVDGTGNKYLVPVAQKTD